MIAPSCSLLHTPFDLDLETDLPEEKKRWMAFAKQKLNEINEPDRLHAWLVTTARRKTWRLLSKERSLQSIHTGEDDDDALVVVDDSPLPDETLVRLEEQHRVRTALARLDDRCQQLITMLYYQTETPPYSEIAAMLGTPEGSIGPTRARCLKKLLKFLEE